MQVTVRISVSATLLAMLAASAGGAMLEGGDGQFAPPGSLVWVGSHRLHLNCMGEGSPTVVFDSGLGGSSLDWVRVQPEVAKFTRACTYDRAGYGWSDAGPLPRDSAHISRELEALLGNASLPAPYLFVGHSFGGYNVRLYSHNNPHMVAGLVLVDSSHEDQFRRFQEGGVGGGAPRHGTFIVRNSLRIPEALPVEVASVARSFAVRRRNMAAVLSELRHLQESAEQLRRGSSLPDVPVVVISHRIDVVHTSDNAERRAKIWMDLQSDLARRTPRGVHVIAATNDHYIHLTQPQLVVDSIRDVFDRSH